ncbi:ABC transporter permease [Streptomyces sp. NPDC053427]|uniref:ABC transporter permease n=1 Tax=Streptomyces sp. NPDC053427 TaxID=3365701 RepID=UPI0037D2739E
MSAGTVLHIPPHGGPPPRSAGPDGPADETFVRRLGWAFADCWTLVRRDLTHLLGQPVNIAWQLGFPVVSVLLFVYVLGSAMVVGDGVDYTTYAMPGIFAMTVAFGFMNTALIVVIDRDRGVTDRFRSLPMAPSAVVSGRGVADLLNAAVGLAVLAGIAVLVGWRSSGGLPATLAAFALLLLLRFALTWIGILIGLMVPNQEMAGGLYALAYPFAMISSVFTPPSKMPDWLGTLARWNPVSSTADATRALFGNPVTTGGSWVESHAVLMAVVWPVVITAVVLPLAVWRFQRLSR